MNDRGVIFDMDGVLCDTGSYHLQSWRDLAKNQGWTISEEFFTQTFGMQNHQIIPHLADSAWDPQTMQPWGDWKEARFRELITGQIKPLPGVNNLVADLSKAGFSLAVGSSGPRSNVEMILRELGLLEKLDAAVASEDVTRGKPYPDTFVLAAEKLGIPCAKCIVVEDAVQGVQAARAAEMMVIAITTTRQREDLREADYVVDNLTELRAADFDNLLVMNSLG